MKEETAKKIRNILDKLEQHRAFLNEYDKCTRKMISVRRDIFSDIGDSIDFSYDNDFKNLIREYIVCKIESLEKQLEEL